jgi:hypothetical protein
MTVPEPRREADPETPEIPPAITPAWGGLHAWACSQRRDWDAAKVKAAMRDAHARNAAYKDAAVILWRLAWDLGAGTRQVLGELSWLNRTGGRAEAPAVAPEVLAALKAGDYELARQLGGTASVVPGQRDETETITEGNDQ